MALRLVRSDRAFPLVNHDGSSFRQAFARTPFAAGGPLRKSAGCGVCRRCNLRSRSRRLHCPSSEIGFVVEGCRVVEVRGCAGLLPKERTAELGQASAAVRDLDERVRVAGRFSARRANVQFAGVLDPSGRKSCRAR